MQNYTKFDITLYEPLTSHSMIECVTVDIFAGELMGIFMDPTNLKFMGKMVMLLDV